MHGHRNGGLPNQLPDPGSAEYAAQRLVLLELVIAPSPDGDELSYLQRVLDVPDAAVEPAVSALEAAGLAARDGAVVRATPPARYFDHLWPVRP
jgi:hypothetical protein